MSCTRRDTNDNGKGNNNLFDKTDKKLAASAFQNDCPILKIDHEQQ